MERTFLCHCAVARVVTYVHYACQPTSGGPNGGGGPPPILDVCLSNYQRPEAETESESGAETQREHGGRMQVQVVLVAMAKAFYEMTMT